MSVTLSNPLASLEQLETTVSRKDGFSEKYEEDLRFVGAELIQSAGILLKLPQVAMATAQVLFQRFYYMASLKEYDIMDISMGALFLASKLEEHTVRMTYLITVYDLLVRKIHNKSIKIPLDAFSQKAYDMKHRVIRAEMEILRKLGFMVYVQLPYNLMINYLRILGLEDNTEVTRRAWNYLNDGLRTTVYVTHKPPTIACAAIYLTCRVLKIALPCEFGKEWWLLFDVDLVNVKNAAAHINRIYFKHLTNEKKSELLDYLLERNNE
ncbi:cyclin-like protein [Mycotypha africana]|uniref:cyclin-like protein n=1 Tax=Mycotypha africana TaxID=64632 RepID=UPI002301D1C8|nr:cyclin-like protein [Mycotypha africana]KAI8981778.1 cyclin-like protein [Mycotypha africana]